MNNTLKSTLTLIAIAALSGCANMPQPDYAAARQGVTSTVSSAGSFIRNALSSPMPAWGETTAGPRTAPPVIELSTGGPARTIPAPSRAPAPKAAPAEAEVQTFPVLPVPSADAIRPISSEDGSATLVVLPNGELGPSKLKN